jgi:hypothetical protein
VLAVSGIVFPLIVVVFAIIYAIDRPLYLRLVAEDGLVEWVTVGILLGGAALGGLALRRLRAQSWRRRWFYGGFIAFCLFCIAEEVSWGQRLFGFQSPPLFEARARQRETNVHNLLQGFTTLKVKEIALGTFIVYGLVLPAVMRRKPAVRAWVEGTGFRVPDAALWPGFLVGSLLAFDRPKGARVEELSELAYSIALVLFMLMELRRLSRDSPPPT